MVSFFSSRLLAAYNSLTDKHLTGYFNNTRIRRHLLRSGLITRSGRILSEKEYKLNIMKRDHQKYIRECLAQAIFHKVLDMERYHQLEIKKKLETLAKKERIQRFKGEPTRWSIENNMAILSPHPPVGPKTNRGHSVLVDEGHSSPITPTSPRPYTAPGNMQPPIRLKPLPSNPAVGTVPKITSGSRLKTSLLENEAPFPIGGKKAVMKFKNSMDNSQAMNRYQLPNINNYMMPIPPPPPPPSGRIARENRLESWRRRRFRPTTAPNGLDPLFTRDSRKIHKTPPHSNAAITMIYLGKTVHLSHDHPDFRDEIKVYQQHCGGENLCVYKGKLLEKETFQFISKRHHGFPFSLTFFLNGMQVNRLSSCCEYKHRKGSRLGGKRGYFGFVCVERSSPCYKCIIAMGLDKNPTSPKPRKEKSIEKREELKKGEGKLRKDRGCMIPRRSEIEGNKTASVIFSAQEEKTGIVEVRTAVEEMELKGKPEQDVWEDAQENIFKYEYEEDFEVDEEKQDEKPNEEGQADDQMNGMSKSPSDDEKDHLAPEKESETLSREAADADDNVKDEGDGCSDSELEEHKQDIKTVSSSSSRSQPCSICSDDESAVEDREAHAGNSPNRSTRSSSSQESSENDEPGRSHLPTEDYLEVEIEDQEIITADVETKPLPIEECLENVLEEEMEEGTQVIAEGLSEKPRERVSTEEKEKDKSKLWEGNTAKKAVLLEEGRGSEKVVLPEEEQGSQKGVLPEEEWGSEKAVLVSEAAALDSEWIQEATALRETATPEKREAEEGEAVSAAGSEKPEVVSSEERASTELQDLGAMGDAAPEREGGSEEAVLGGEEPAEERKAAVGPGTPPWSSSTSEKAEAARMGLWEDSLEELCKEDAEREEAGAEAESNKEDGKKEMFPEELGVARGRTKAERPGSPLEETESEREEVTSANAQQGEDILEEEQKVKGEEQETMKEVRPEEETQVSQNEMECDAEGEAPMGASELTEDTGPQGGDSRRERQGAMFEAASGHEEEARDPEHKGRAELLPRENRAPLWLDQGLGLEGEGVLGAPGTELAGTGQAPEAMITATGEARGRAAKDQDGLAGREGRDEEGPLQGEQGAGVTAMTEEDVSEEDSMMAEKLSEETMGEDPEEEADEECARVKGVRRKGDPDGEGSLPGGAVVADEALHQGEGAAAAASEKREVLADLKAAEGKTEANKASSLSDVAGKETWHQVEELLGKPAAAEKVVAEERALSGEAAPAVEEVTGTRAPEAEVGAAREPSVLGGKAAGLGQHPAGGGAEPMQWAESVGQEAGPGCCADHGQALGAAGEFSPGVSGGTESEPRAESPQGMHTLPVKPDYTESQERQERTVQRERENLPTQMSP
uniref:Glutamate rich 3 n=1 Tax=Ursus americanus TaxID=9643 RepID=A0A452R584_URSAM